MRLPKSQLAILVLTIILVIGGAYYLLNGRDSPEKAGQRLADQNIAINEDNFFAEIKAQHMANIHDFLMAGGAPGTLDLKGNGISALMIAVQTGNKDIVALMLSAVPGDPQEAGKILNLRTTTEGETALMMAVEEKKADIAQLLLNRGADTAVTDKTGATALILAVRAKAIDLLKPLIDADAKQHQGLELNTADMHGDTPLTHAILDRNKEMVQALIAFKADAATPDRGGITPLMVAAGAGDDAIGAALITAGAKTDTADNQGNTPLSIAIRHGNSAFVKMLIAKGADADYHTTGPLPLQLAISAEPFDGQMFALLLEHSKHTVKLDASLLFDAIDHKNGELAKALLAHGIDANATNESGQTLLYRAIESGLEDTALALIDKGADISKTGVMGANPLERAIKHNEVKVVKKLLAMGASPDQKTAEGYTLAEMAVYNGYPEILDALLAKGAKLEKDFSVLWAIRDGGGKSVPVLLKYGAHPNVMSNSGDPALWLAASGGETEAVAALIQYHAALDYPNTAQAMTPLAIASHVGHLDVVKLLVDAGAKLEQSDAFGMTPLAHAAYMSKVAVVQYLISKGANVNAADKQGRSVADLAALAEASTARDQVITMLNAKSQATSKAVR